MAAGCVLAACPLFDLAARADRIILTNGRVIEADRTWYDGTQLRYEKNGGAYGLPRSLVKSVEADGRPGEPPTVASPAAPVPVAPPPSRKATPAAQFRIRYDGGINERWAWRSWTRSPRPTRSTRGASASLPRTR